jgi:hypothetical protein
MSSIMRCRRDVMESSFAKWNVLRAATPWFRKGTAEEAKREQLKGRRA